MCIRDRDGHAPFLSSGDLAAYALAGIATDHECVDYEYAMEECRNGMQVLIREGSAARNLDAIVSGLSLIHILRSVRREKGVIREGLHLFLLTRNFRRKICRISEF